LHCGHNNFFMLQRYRLFPSTTNSSNDVSEARS
jgi:hypothetical protein